MKRFLIVFLICLCFISDALSEIDTHDIFLPKSTHTHSSSIIQLENGWLLSCWYEGSGERKANDVQIKGAALLSGGGTSNWSKPFTMADTPGLPDCNPVLFYDDQMRIWLYWIIPIGNHWENSLLVFKRADKVLPGGEPLWNWQGNIILSPGDNFTNSLITGFKDLQLDESMWSEYAQPYSKQLIAASRIAGQRQTGWMTRNHPIHLSKGHWIIPLYSDGFNLSLMAITRDGGQTWTSSKPIIGLGPIQPALVLRKKNEVIAFMRDSGPKPGRVLVSLSKDKGYSWSLARDTEIPNPGSSVDILKSQSGNWLLVGNFNEKDRSQLEILGSKNSGDNWNYRLILSAGKSNAGHSSFSYPSIIQDLRGKIHITYSAAVNGQETIRHVILNEKEIFNDANQFGGWATFPQM